MKLGQLKEMFSRLDPNTELQYGISEPFSWRGSYDEVAFSFEPLVNVKTCLERIDMAMSQTFYGYKGGEYKYYADTPVNFEPTISFWSDGEYCENMISVLLDQPEQNDREKYVISLLINEDLRVK